MKSLNLVFLCVFSIILIGCSKGCSSSKKPPEKAIEAELLDGANADDVGESEEVEVSVESPVDESSFVEDSIEDPELNDEDEYEEEVEEEISEDSGDDDYSEDDPE